MELTALLNEVESRAALPNQQLAVSMATLPKPNGGERQICLIGMITRLWGRCRASLARQWDS
eukprot:8454545-Alexandrium_andersonii.AAC.1